VSCRFSHNHSGIEEQFLGFGRVCKELLHDFVDIDRSLFRTRDRAAHRREASRLLQAAERLHHPQVALGPVVVEGHAVEQES
jgi:hypothetical protein